jgi:hypothetical protein
MNNRNWQGKLLFDLYKKHESTSDDPVAAAGKDSGWLLKKVIDQDKRSFDKKKEDLIIKYCWNDMHSE